MGGAEVKWQTQVKYLGNILNSSNPDGDDITCKRDIYYSNVHVNKLLAYFNHLPSQALTCVIISSKAIVLVSMVLHYGIYKVVISTISALPGRKVCVEFGNYHTRHTDIFYPIYPIMTCISESNLP